MSERERLLRAFFDAAAADGEYVRDWANIDDGHDWANPTAGDEVQMDGDFNIWAGIQAVIAQAKADAWDEGWAGCEDQPDDFKTIVPNPYRTNENEATK